MFGWRTGSITTPDRITRLALVVIGISLGQFLLYGPSLIGTKILLPLDILVQQNVYTPRTPEVVNIEAQNPTATDQIYVYEPNRHFYWSELKAGRFPLWAPFQFAGVPFIWPKFSPFLLIESLTSSPLILAWVQLLVALVAGMGAYLFFRFVLEVNFWPAAIGSWCYPLTGFFVLWLGCPTGMPVAWLPWVLLMVHFTVFRSFGLAPVGLAVITALVLVSGFPDVAGEVLLGAGLFGLWQCFFGLSKTSSDSQVIMESSPSTQPSPPGEGVRTQSSGSPRFFGALTRLAGGWVLGFLLAAPYLLPVVEYSRSGSRIARRGAGHEERPPIGLSAIPQVVLPNMYGIQSPDSLRYAPDHPAESSAASYAGLFATLLVAPLAAFSRRHNRLNIFWIILSLFALAWCFNVPGMVQIFRLRGLNMLSYNRLVFLASFALIALTVTGLEVLTRGLLQWRSWVWVPVSILGLLCCWCVFRASTLPEPIQTQISSLILQGKTLGLIHDQAGVERVQRWFIQYYLIAALLSGIGVLGWFALRAAQNRQSRYVPVLALLMLADLVWFGHYRVVQCAPSLYFPKVPALEWIKQAGSGRVMGYACLPANLSAMAGLNDVRGYDAVDPTRMVDIISLGADGVSSMPRYAKTMQVAPKAIIAPNGEFRVSPVMEMLGLRYIILRGSPPANAVPDFKAVDYWVMKNRTALDRAFIPQRVETVTDDKLRLEKLASPSFNPRELAYVEVPLNLPPICAGTATVTDAIPGRVSITARMDTAGLIVLADRWDKGWRAYLDDKTVPILYANHALRGVVCPPGEHRLVFRYDPASFAWGIRMAGIGAGVILIWIAVAFGKRNKGNKV